MNTSWNSLGKAFWNGGIFGAAKTMINENRGLPQAGTPAPNWKDLPLLTIDDRGFSGFNVKDPKWLEKMRDVQPVTMARPYPTLCDLECDLIGMRLVTGDEIGELKKIDAFILQTFGKESSVEVRVQLALRPREASGPTVPLELTVDEVRLLRIITAYMIGHEEGGGIPSHLWAFIPDWGTAVKRLRSLCRFAAAIPLVDGTMRLGTREYLGVKEMSIAALDFLRIAVDGPLSVDDNEMKCGTGVSPFVHFALFTVRDMPEILTTTSLAKKLVRAADQLEKLGIGIKTGDPIFVISRKSFDFLLHDWYDRIAKVKPILVPREPGGLPNLWDLGSTIMDECGMTIEETKEWGNVAHAIREHVGVDNLSEVLLEFDETI